MMLAIRKGEALRIAANPPYAERRCPAVGSADFIGNERIVFNIRGNRYRLVVCVRYAPLYLVYVRFIGTHAEYDAIDVKTI